MEIFFFWVLTGICVILSINFITKEKFRLFRDKYYRRGVMSVLWWGIPVIMILYYYCGKFYGVWK